MSTTPTYRSLPLRLARRALPSRLRRRVRFLLLLAPLYARHPLFFVRRHLPPQVRVAVSRVLCGAWRLARDPRPLVRAVVPARARKPVATLVYRFIINPARTSAARRTANRSSLSSALTSVVHEKQPQLVMPSGGSGESLRFPLAMRPDVSIIVPVHDQWEYTHRCLQAVLEHTEDIQYEVILADDASVDATVRATDLLENVVVLRDGVRRGFLDNCNEAVKHARGRYLVLLNNDTAVQPGWLHYLLEVVEEDPRVGIVGPKLVYGDGTLQEAGGIIFADGNARNYGRGGDTAAPEFNYRKEVDYISGACLLVRRSLWDAVGGFDRRYAPGYYEDPDLAFAARQQGFRVVYQPQSVVVHFEGVSHGRDLSTGVKRYQVVNSAKFCEKWESTLTAEQETPDHLFWARDRSRSKTTILVIDHEVPQYDRDAGSRFMWAYLKLFVHLGCHVTFLSAKFDREEPYTSELQRLGIEVLYGDRYRARIKDWIREHGKYLDVVYIHKPFVAAEYIDIIRSHTQAKIVYCPADLHWIREQRRFEVTGVREAGRYAAYWQDSERNVLEKVNVVHVVSEYERAILHEILPDKPIRTVPVYVFDEEPPAEVPPFEYRCDLMFVAGFLHEPNQDAAEWFVEEVMPVIRQALPGVRLHLVGSGSEVVSGLACEDVVVTGRVSERALRLLYRRMRVVVCPLRFGAGVKGKVVESLFHRVPAVVTPIAAEGLPDIEWYVAVAGGTEEFVAQVIELYESRDRWNRLSGNAGDYVRTRFSRETAASVVARDLCVDAVPSITAV